MEQQAEWAGPRPTKNATEPIEGVSEPRLGAWLFVGHGFECTDWANAPSQEGCANSVEKVRPSKPRRVGRASKWASARNGQGSGGMIAWQGALSTAMSNRPMVDQYRCDSLMEAIKRGHKEKSVCGLRSDQGERRSHHVLR